MGHFIAETTKGTPLQKCLAALPTSLVSYDLAATYMSASSESLP